MTYDWQSAGYKRERDEAQKETREVQYKLNTQTAMLKQIVTAINNSCEDEVLTFDDFMYYFTHAIESDEEIFVDQFTTLMMSAKVIFGEDLHKIRTAEQKKAAEYRAHMLKAQAERERLRTEYEEVLAFRTEEREQSVSTRTELLKRIQVTHSTLGDLSDDDKQHAEALIKSNNLEETFWLKRLRIKSLDDVPPEHEKGYYEASDHPGCRTGRSYYDMLATLGGYI